MYSYTYDETTGGIILNTDTLEMSKEPRPVFYNELDILGFDKYCEYKKDDSAPYMWAEANKYFYKGRLIAEVEGGSAFNAPKLKFLEKASPKQKLLQIDIKSMVKKNKIIIDSLSQDTIKKIYNYYIKYKNKIDIFYVAFSGGKDSVVALDLVQRALPHNAFKVLFGDTGMEFPDTYKLVEKIKLDCKEKEIDFLTATSHLNPEKTWRIFGPPARSNRWCCSVHKTTPQIMLLRKLLNKADLKGMAFTGIRKAESSARSEYDEISFEDKIQGQYSYHVILNWNSAELYLYIFANNLILNEAYKKGNSRAGCLVCPMAASKNIFFKEKCYGESKNGKSTQTFNNIILETTSKVLSTKQAKLEFIDNRGWTARKSGRELSIAKVLHEEELKDGILKVTIFKNTDDWKEWLKTLGKVVFFDDSKIDVLFQEKLYSIKHNKLANKEEFIIPIVTNKKIDIDFVASLKIIFRKSAYCIRCNVCASNCPHGFINMSDNSISISDNCYSCRKCHEIEYGCLIANSLKIPKGENKMGSIDRYGNLGVREDWVRKYFNFEDNQQTNKADFWNSANGLGSNMIKYLRNYLSDSEVMIKGNFTDFGRVVAKLGLDNPDAWALMLCNLAYSSEFNWWIKNIKPNNVYSKAQIDSMLGDNYTNNSKDHIIAAFRIIFTDLKYFNNPIGLGECYQAKEEGSKTKTYFFSRKNWNNEIFNPLVMLYSLYKFAEKCKSYDFTLNKLLNHDLERDGISPTEIFSIEKEQMKQILNGLSLTYSEFINVSFTHDLDSIRLNNEKHLSDILTLF